MDSSALGSSVASSLITQQNKDGDEKASPEKRRPTAMDRKRLADFIDGHTNPGGYWEKKLQHDLWMQFFPEKVVITEEEEKAHAEVLERLDHTLKKWDREKKASAQQYTKRVPHPEEPK